MTTKEEVLKNCTVEGTVVKLPNTHLDRKLYQEVAKSLELIGGKWKGGKVFGFTFLTNPTELLEEIASGEKRNLKKEYQFFATPDNLADRLVYLADLEPDDYILEPSAGQGAIIKAINRVFSDMAVDYAELMPINRNFLDKMPNTSYIGDDFLVIEVLEKKYPTWNKIIANPPFSKNQDIDHVYKMYECLEDGGRIVTITSNHWETSNNKKETGFRNWLNSINAEILDIDKGTFKDSGTMVGGKIIIINK